MTPRLSERIRELRHNGNIQIEDMYEVGDVDAEFDSLIAEVEALEAKLAAARKLPGKWRKYNSDGSVYSNARESTFWDTANDLWAALGEDET